jgi:hypothetical protein
MAKPAKTPTNKSQSATDEETQEQYRQRIMDIVCGCMAEGQSLRRICKSVEGIPSHSTIIGWCNDSEELADQYTRARKLMTDYRFDEYQDAAGEIVKKYIADGWEPKDAIAIARLECDNMKWALSKLNAKKYGEKITQEVVGDNGGPVQFKNVVDLTDEQLLAMIAAGK